MKKTLSLLLVCLLAVGLLAACGGGKAATGSTVDYAELITSLRDTNENTAFPVVTSPDNDKLGMVLDLVGVSTDDMQRYAISASLNNVVVYGVAIILPEAGKADSVKKALNAFVQAMKDTQENYLPFQYEIASNAIIREAPTGEIVLVMCENATTMFDNILKGLKEG